MLVLGIETSCDETAAALVEDGVRIRANVVGSQVDHHQPYGGVVPEVAARAHLESLLAVLDEVLVEGGATYAELDGVAVTNGPGLVGSLLVGLSAGKSIAVAHDLPLIAANHLEGHVAAAQLEYGALAEPLLALVVSGGHTSLVLTGPEGGFTTVGATMDDAAGEAFDKVGRFMGLAYPGGPAIDRLARDGDPTAVGFPRPTVDGADFDFSMSGLKTAVTRELRRRQARGEPLALADVAASFQEAAVETQVATTLAAARAHGVGQVAVVGGVAANSRLRASMSDACQRAGLGLVLPSPTLCTDNGAMIAAAGSNHLAAGEVSALDVDVAPGAELTGEPA